MATGSAYSVTPDATGPAAEQAGGGLFTLRWRLAVAFLVVAFSSVSLLLALVLVFIRADVANASRRQSTAIEQGLVAALRESHLESPTWAPEVVGPILALATEFQAHIVVRDASGAVVARNAPLVSQAVGPPARLAIEQDGVKVGTLTVQLARNGAVTSDLGLQTSLAVAVGLSAALAALVAVVASALVAERLARPVGALTSAARRLKDGHWEVRLEQAAPVRELQELGEAFNSLASSLEREDELRRTLTAEIAHELRTPLAVLQVSTEALADGIVPATQQTFQSLRAETLRLSRLIEDLEQLAEAQAAVLHLDVHPVRLDLVAGETASELTLLAEEAGVELWTELEPVEVLGDERRIRQIVTNLLTNAIKFTPAPGQVVLSTRPASPREGEVTVADTGVGIPKEHQARVFERFWRAEGAAEIPGTGIGLAIVGELVAAHRGRIELQSEPGRGSRFTVTLARAPAPRGGRGDGRHDRDR